MIRVSAPGKVHLIGEHAVVYGYPAIIAAVGRRVYVEAEKSENIILKDDRFNRIFDWKIDEVKKTSYFAKNLWEECKEKEDFMPLFKWNKKNDYENYWKAILGIALEMNEADSGLFLHITKSEIPLGSGLGSSSAAAVAIAEVVGEVYENNPSLDKVNDIAYEIEKIGHGNPSGGDNTACCYGGLIWFQKHGEKRIVKPLKKEIQERLENFIFVYTVSPKKTTGELVQMVRKLPETERNEKMREIERMTYELISIIKKKDYDRMKEIINRTNDILSSFGLSVKETEMVAKKIVSMGGAAKMCGACGGGVMLIWHEEPEKAEAVIKKMGFETFRADIGVEGVTIEK